MSSEPAAPLPDSNQPDVDTQKCTKEVAHQSISDILVFVKGFTILGERALHLLDSLLERRDYSAGMGLTFPEMALKCISPIIST